MRAVRHPIEASPELLGLLGALFCASAASGGEPAASGSGAHTLDPITVTARRLADEQVKQQVETALHQDAFFYDAHVSVTIKDGVATLSGLVFDEWDLRMARRITKRVPGVKRVVDDLEIKLGGE